MEEFEDEDEVTRQEELDAAQAIIDESKTAAINNATPEPTTPKRKRGRPRKEDVQKKLEEIDLTPRKRSRRAVVEKRENEKKQLELEALFSSGEDSDDVYDDSGDEHIPKRKRPSSRPIKLPKKLRVENEDISSHGISSNGTESPFTSPKKEEKRKKKGRPSKQDNVTKQVHSIFQMDDLELFQDSIHSNKSSPEKSARVESSAVSLNFDNTGKSSYSAVPVISGIQQQIKGPEKELKRITKFEPFAVPDLDEDGNIKDPEYIRKYLSGVNVDLNGSGRLTDERAFFLEGSEGYFEQHNLRFRPSSNSLALNAPALEYEEFIPMVELGKMIYASERNHLFEFHRQMYHQWCFELSQGYSINLFGVGSKMELILDFVENYLVKWYEHTFQIEDDYPVIMVVNGYNASTKLKTVIHDIVSAIITPEMQKQNNIRMPKHVSEAFPFLMNHLKKKTTKDSGMVKPDLVLVVQNIDGEAFRDERSQNFLSQLSALANVWFITSTDNVNASLLWDLYRLKNFNFLWHNSTTFRPYTVEMSFKDVLNMGRSKKFVGSKGARYVLTSLNANSRSLYRVLLQMQLQKMLESTSSKAGQSGIRGNAKNGVEMRLVYEKCLQEYVTSNEMSFRSILGEYVEHKMCTLTKNSGGTEIVFVPFSSEEMKKILKDEFGEQ